MALVKTGVPLGGLSSLRTLKQNKLSKYRNYEMVYHTGLQALSAPSGFGSASCSQVCGTGVYGCVCFTIIHMEESHVVS